MTYPTLANLKSFLKISGNGEDTTLQWIIDGAISWFEGETGRMFVAVDETRIFPAQQPYVNSKRNVFTPMDEFTAVNSFTLPDASVVPDTDYFLLPAKPPYIQLSIYEDSAYRLLKYPFGSIQADFDWGYSAACPDDVFSAILHVAQFEWVLRETGGVAGAAQEQQGGRITVAVQDLPEIIQRAVRRYKR